MNGVLAEAQSEIAPSTLHYHNPDRAVTPDEVFGKDKAGSRRIRPFGMPPSPRELKPVRFGA